MYKFLNYNIETNVCQFEIQNFAKPSAKSISYFYWTLNIAIIQWDYKPFWLRNTFGQSLFKIVGILNVSTDMVFTVSNVLKFIYQ